MKTIPFLYSLLLLNYLRVTPSTGVVYYVRPSITTQCPSQPCETLQYYFDNVHTTINQQHNVTMIFLPGTHTVTNVSVVVNVLIVEMKGADNQNVTVNGSTNHGLVWINFVNVSSLRLMNLAIKRCLVIVQMAKTATSSQFEMTSLKLYQSPLKISSARARLKFDGSEFHCGLVSIYTSQSLVTITDCKSFSNPINVQNSTLEILGVSLFTVSNRTSAITVYYCNVTLSGRLLFANNSGIRGGAMALYSSTLNLAPSTEVKFINNSASEIGGAMYINPSLMPNQLLSIMAHDSLPIAQPLDIHPPCFYRLLDCSDTANYTFTFANNSAGKGGDDVFGASLRFHRNSLTEKKCNLTVSGVSSSISSVTSDPTRVCLCDRHGRPQCENNSYIFKNYAVRSGEVFSVLAAVVGGDYGTTIGPVFADFLSIDHSSAPSFTTNSQHIQVLTDSQRCSKLNYSLHYFDRGKIIIYLTTVYIGTLTERVLCMDESCFHTTPVFLNMTLLNCPPGLTLLGEPPVCDCYNVLSEKDVKCSIIDGKGVFSWNGSLWVTVERDNIIYGQYCPFNYCKSNVSQGIALESDSNAQCGLNRAGRLCGGCMKNYSLAIGSSHCIHCPNDNNLALLIFFAAAGFLLVFFISALNLTVTQGTINGLIFYANVVWIYQSIFFPEEQKMSALLVFLKTFMAWINLDFGIETCFVSGLTAFWKTWLQFIFPFYLWAIAGLIIVAARYSSRLTNLLGNRAVPVLDTLFLLSYMKLLRLVAAAMVFSVVTKYPQRSTLVVWSVDGNLGYFGIPHVFLFLAGLATLLFLGLPYTLLLFLMQWLRRLQQFRILKWMMRFHPVYDAYFAPLQHQHQYWFGLLLLVRGILLLTFASTFTVPQNINLLLLFTLGVILLFYIAQTHPYKTKTLHILHSAFLVNVTLLSGSVIFTQTHPNGPTLQAVAVTLSTGAAFLKFCGIVIHAVVAPRCSSRCLSYRRRRQISMMSSNIDKSGNEVEPVVADDMESTGYRDSILNDDTQPLLTNDSDAKYKQLE